MSVKGVVANICERSRKPTSFDFPFGLVEIFVMKLVPVLLPVKLLGNITPEYFLQCESEETGNEPAL